MAQRKPKTVLFLTAGNPLSGRCAEALFNSVTAKMGLPWAAAFRRLAVDGGQQKAGRMSAASLDVVKGMGLRATDELTRPPADLGVEDLETADRIVALNQVEQLPLVEERFPGWVDRVEGWAIDDSPEGLALIQHEVMDLTARLIRGGQRQPPPPPELCPQCRQPVGTCTCQTGREVPKNVTVRVGRETKGRRGKGVTTVSDLPLDESELAELAARLKQRLGTGGTVKDRRIEIQGDQRDRLIRELEGLGYRVKRVGG
jgi:translation initiation factor 1